MISQSLRKAIGLMVIGSCLMMAGCKGQTQEYPANSKYRSINPSADFMLHDQDGRIFRLKDHRGQIVLLFFGYISCPDVCPTTLSKLARVYSLLGTNRQKVLTAFVSIDPQRDTPQRLKEYLQYFNINVLGLTGTKEEIDRVVDAYKASYEKVQTDSTTGYLFNHSDYLYLINTAGQTAHLFHPEDKAQDIAGVITKL